MITMNANQALALYGVAHVAGMVIGWRMWPKHPVIGAILGGGVGFNAVSLLTGRGFMDTLREAQGKAAPA